MDSCVKWAREGLKKAVAVVKRIGGSLMVLIPAEAAAGEGIEEGDMVEIQVKKSRKSWFGAYKGVGPMTHEDQFDTHD